MGREYFEVILEQVRKRQLPRWIWHLSAGLVLSTLLSWFALHQYLTALPVAEENLRGLALSLSSAVEAVSGRDPSFSVLEGFHSPEIAYLEIIDGAGTVLFHSNRALMGTRVPDGRFAPVFNGGDFSGGRIVLGTGEEIYESNSPIHVRGKTLALRLALHTYRADNVIRRGKAGMAVLFSLIALTWIMGALLHRSSLAAEAHKREMARREHLARMGEMGAILAHEIRNPLAGIKGYAQLIMEDAGSGETVSATQLIVAEAVRLEEMVNGLLAYSRSERGEPEPVDLRHTLERSLALMAAEASASGVAIESAVEDSLLIGANRDRLEQLFLNLFKNALQAMPGGGRLGVSARRRGRRVEIAVSDTGPGIGPENLERIFEPFFTTRARGTGLGLAVCRKITEDYGGEIRAESRPGEGTLFTVSFPVLEIPRRPHLS